MDSAFTPRSHEFHLRNLLGTTISHLTQVKRLTGLIDLRVPLQSGRQALEMAPGSTLIRTLHQRTTTIITVAAIMPHKTESSIIKLQLKVAVVMVLAVLVTRLLMVTSISLLESAVNSSEMD